MYVLPTPGGQTIGFVLPPKTGSRSIAQWASKLEGATRVGGRHGIGAIERCDTVFATIRNPFDVLVSWFHYDPYGERAGLSFTAYLDGIIRKKRNDYLKTSTLPHAELADRCLRYENGLQNEINVVTAEFGWPTCSLDHIGQARSRKPYRDYYTPEMVARVVDRFRADLFTFDYEF